MVPLRFDLHQLDDQARMKPTKLLSHPVGLPARQVAATGTDPDHSFHTGDSGHEFVTYKVVRSVRATTATTTLAAPACLRALAAAPQVAPVVRTSSTRSTVRPLRLKRLRARNALCTISPRAVRPSSASLRVATTRLNNRRTESLSRRAIPSASASDWLYPRCQCRHQCSGTGTTRASEGRLLKASCRASTTRSMSHEANQAFCSCLSRRQRSRSSPSYDPIAYEWSKR